jgi:hypothetical protein
MQVSGRRAGFVQTLSNLKGTISSGFANTMMALGTVTSLLDIVARDGYFNVAGANVIWPGADHISAANGTPVYDFWTWRQIGTIDEGQFVKTPEMY